MEWKCTHCDLVLTSKRKKYKHMHECHADLMPEKGKAWNSGKTKETNETVARIGKILSERYSGENSAWYGRHHTEESKKKLAAHGGYRKGSGRGKSGWYKGYFCDSTWELAFVVYNLEHNIKFERNTKTFPYVYQGENKSYLPDWLIDGKYIEIKGYWNEQWQAKLDQFPKDETLIVLTEKEMKPYFDYVIEKYGKNYIELYDGYNPKIKTDKIRKHAVLTFTEMNRRKELILNSGVDLTKRGWVMEVSRRTGLGRHPIKDTVNFFDDLRQVVFRR